MRNLSILFANHIKDFYHKCINMCKRTAEGTLNFFVSSFNFGKKAVKRTLDFFVSSFNFSKKAVKGTLDFSVSCFNFGKKAVKETLNFCKNVYANAVHIKNHLRKNPKKYYAISLISLCTLAGASMMSIFGVGLTSLVTSLFPKLLSKMILGTCIAVPAAGLIGGNLASSALCKSCGIETSNAKRILQTSIISLGTLAGASLSLLLGFGAISATSVLLPKLYTLVTLGTFALVPIGGIASGITVSNLNSDKLFDFPEQAIIGNTALDIASTSTITPITIDRTHNRALSRESNSINIPEETRGRSRSRSNSFSFDF